MRGYVVAADTGTPLRRAMVNARSQDGRGGGMATTDSDGRFEIKELPGGRYFVTASKAGYVSTQYGQRRPEQSGTVLEILDGQTVEKIAFALPRGGVITGRVSDEFGDPIAGAQMSALRYRYMNGARRLMPSGSAQTDDRGSFRIYGLVPGEYYVSGGLRTQEIMFGMPTAGSTSVEGYAPTYFPGTPNASEAGRVTVRVARETTDVSFSLTATRLVQISGRAVSSTGEPYVQAFVSIMPVDRFAAGMPMGMGGGMTRADGTFQINGVAPGAYNLTLRPRNMPDPTAEFGHVRVSVGNDNVDNILIVTSRGATARGTIVSDDGTALPVRPQQARIFARPVEPEAMVVMGGEPKVNDDWTFEITGLSEHRIIGASLADSQDWALKAVYFGGQDVTDSPIEFVPGRDVEGLQIVFTRKRTELSGGISNERGQPETDATVIIFADDRARWTFASRFVRTARPNQDGRYSMRGMPPHDYLVVAVRDIESGQWQDPDVLESLRDQAARVSLGQGETKVQDLKVGRLP
jgi:protocatechuate 3,4-dioxygenase beta subunit